MCRNTCCGCGRCYFIRKAKRKPTPFIYGVGFFYRFALSYFSNTTVVTERAGRAKAFLLVPLSVFAKSLSLSVT